MSTAASSDTLPSLPRAKEGKGKRRKRCFSFCLLEVEEGAFLLLSSFSLHDHILDSRCVKKKEEGKRKEREG